MFDPMIYMSAAYEECRSEAEADYRAALQQPDISPFRHKVREPDVLLRFDRYKRLKQASVLFTQASDPAEIHHFVATDLEGWDSAYKHVVPTHLHAVGTGPQSEGDLVRGFWNTINHNGPITSVAGWKILTTILPLLVCKGFEYGAAIPQAVVSDPAANYKTQCVYSVDAVYTQGIYSHARYTPELHELMEWWGLQSNDGWPMLDRVRLAHLKDSEWAEYGLANVEKYLHAMVSIVNMYRRSVCSASYVAGSSKRGPA